MSEVMAQSVTPLRYLERLAEDGSSQEAMQAFLKVAERLPESDMMLFNLASMRDTLPEVARELYIERPNLISSVQQLILGADGIRGVRGVDWLCNPVRSLSSDASKAWAQTLEMGVFDTLAEAAVLRMHSEGMDLKNAALDFSRLPGQWLLLDGEAEAGVYGRCAPEVRASIEDSIGSGLKVVVPGDGEIRSWYVLNASTGNALGMGLGHFGLGGESSVSYTILLVAVGKAALAGFLTFVGCYKLGSGNPGSAGGCATCAVIAAIGMFAVVLAVPLAMPDMGMAAEAMGWAGAACAAMMTQFF
jgi:hypothetical protein